VLAPCTIGPISHAGTQGDCVDFREAWVSGFQGPTCASLLRRRTRRCRVVIGDLDVQAGEQTVREIENLGRWVGTNECNLSAPTILILR